MTKVGDREVITAGSLVLGEDDRTATIIVDRWEVVIQFANAGSSPPAAQFGSGPNSFSILLTNWSNTLGLAMSGSINVSPRIISYTIAVHSIGDLKPKRVLSYTFSWQA